MTGHDPDRSGAAQSGAEDARVNQLLAAAPVVIYSCTPGGVYATTFVSDNVFDLLGYRAQEILDDANFWPDHVHPEDLARVLEQLTRISEQGHQALVYRYRAADGGYRWMYDEVRLITDADGQPVELVGAWMDITGRLQAEEALRESEQRFRQLAENIKEVFWMTDPGKDAMLYVSPGYEAIWGRTPESLYDRPISWVDAIHPGDRLRVLEAALLKQARGDYDEEYRILRPGGEVRWVRDRAFPIRDANGDVYRIAGIAEDITQRKLAEEELRVTSERLAQAREETVLLLAAAAEQHDHVTGLHFHRVRELTEALALERGLLADVAREIGLAAVLHDVGKIRVPQEILASSGPLSDHQWSVMKQHPVWGRELLQGRPGFDLATAVACCHHERWDGTGYPVGRSGEDIPEAAAIVAVADAFDAITNDRPYRAARSAEEAVHEIAANSGKQFSPKVVQALLALHARAALPGLSGSQQAAAAA